MKGVPILLIILLIAVDVSAQRSNDIILKQIKSLSSQRSIDLKYDVASDMSKIVVIADTFDSKESSKAGIQAMNFGLAASYSGKSMVSQPQVFDLTFWVLTNKPRFATANRWIAELSEAALDLGEARYASKLTEKMEYLNFKISRADLMKFSESKNVKFSLGSSEFTFTRDHLMIFKDILKITALP